MKKFNVVKLVESICRKYNIKCEDLKHDLVVVALECTNDIHDNEQKIQVAYDEVIKYLNSNSKQDRPKEVGLSQYNETCQDVLDKLIDKEFAGELLLIKINHPNANTYSDVLNIHHMIYDK